MNRIFVLLAGGAIGALLRYLIAKSIPNTAFPWSVLIVNSVGCYFIGLLWHASEIRRFSSDMKIFIFIGLFGAFTNLFDIRFGDGRSFQSGPAAFGTVEFCIE
jgi:CrcB protein